MGVPEKGNNDIWGVIYKNGSSQDRKLLLALCLFYGFTSIYIMGYPLWFKEPNLICHSGHGSFECSEIEACNLGNFTISKSSSKSLSKDFELVCDRLEDKRRAISFSLLGYLIGLVLNMILPLNAENRKNWIGLCSMLFFVGEVTTLLFPASIKMISCGLCLMGVAYSSGYNNSVVLISEVFTEQFSQVSFIFMMIFYSIFGIFYPIFSYITDDNWKLLNLVTAFFSVTVGIFIFSIQTERSKEEEALKKKTVSIGNFYQQLQGNKYFRKNFIIFTISWTTMLLTLVGVNIELEGVGGSLHLNMIMFALLEALTSWITGLLIVKYDLFTLKKLSYFLSGLFLVVFVFAPTDIKTLQGYIKLIYIVPVLLNEAGLVIAWNLTVIFIPKIFEGPYISLVLSTVMFLARCIISLTPYINFIFFKINLHPFVLYCLLWFLTLFLFNYYELNVNDNISLNKTNSLTKHDKSSTEVEMISVPFDAVNAEGDSFPFEQSKVCRNTTNNDDISSISYEMNKPLLNDR